MHQIENTHTQPGGGGSIYPQLFYRDLVSQAKTVGCLLHQRRHHHPHLLCQGSDRHISGHALWFMSCLPEFGCTERLHW